MFVVRLTPPDDGPDFKVFRRREDARRYFLAGYRHVWSTEELSSATLFEVANVDDPSKAIQLVKEGKATLVETDGQAELQKTVDNVIQQMIDEGKL